MPFGLNYDFSEHWELVLIFIQFVTTRNNCVSRFSGKTGKKEKKRNEISWKGYAGERSIALGGLRIRLIELRRDEWAGKNNKALYHCRR